MQNLLLSVNAVGPILLLVALGALLRRKGAIDDAFVKKANTLAYTYSLPFALFEDSYTASAEAAVNPALMAYAVGSIVAACAALCLIAPRFIPDRRRCGRSSRRRTPGWRRGRGSAHGAPPPRPTAASGRTGAGAGSG